MTKRVSSLLCIGLLLVVSISSVFASINPVNIQIRTELETIQEIRYQTGILPENTWKSAPSPGYPLVLEDFDSETEFLFVQQAETENAWGPLYVYQYEKKDQIWSLVPFSPKHPLKFYIKSLNDLVQMFRYQYGTEPDKAWQIVGTSGPSLVIEQSDNAREFLFIQQTYGQDEWSQTYAYQYDYLKKCWSLASFPPKNLLEFSLKPTSDFAQLFRYQYGAEPNKTWQTADISGSPLSVEQSGNVREFLFVQQTQMEDAWGRLYVYRYDKEKNDWPLVSNPSNDDIWFRIQPASDPVQMVKYQDGAESDKLWQTADTSGAPLVIELFDSEKELLFVQQMNDKDEWGQAYADQYDNLKQSGSFLPPKQDDKPSLIESFDVKAYGLIPTGFSSKCYSYLAGVGIQANIPLGKFLGYTGLTFSKGPPKSDSVKSQQALALSMGIGYSIPLSKKMALIPEVGYGFIFHLLEVDFDNDGIYEPDMFIDQQVRLALYLTYALNERYKLFIAPFGVLFFEKEDFGIMYGCQVGLRVSL